MSIASSKRFKSVQLVPKQSLAYRPKTFEPQHMSSRQIPLPQSKKVLLEDLLENIIGLSFYSNGF